MNWPDWLDARLLVAVAAAVFSFFSLLTNRSRRATAIDNNFIASSAPWAQLLTSKLAEEVANAIQDKSVFHRLYGVPFKAAQEKIECREKLLRGRELSANTLQFLRVLTSEEDVKPLIAAKDRLDRLEDSYAFRDGELTLDATASHRIDDQYRVAFDEYVVALRSFALNVNGSITKDGNRRVEFMKGSNKNTPRLTAGTEREG
jgi:hypothetical protein